MLIAALLFVVLLVAGRFGGPVNIHNPSTGFVAYLALGELCWCLAVGSLVFRLWRRQWMDLRGPAAAAMVFAVVQRLWYGNPWQVELYIENWPPLLAVCVVCRDAMRALVKGDR